MVEIGGRPLVDWVLRRLAKNGIETVVMGVAYQKEKIIGYVGNGDRYGMNVRYSSHTVEGGTAEGFRLAIERYVNDDCFVAMNGDELTDVNLQELAAHHLSMRGVATIAVTPLRSQFGVVRLQDNDVVGFEEKPVISSLPVSIGVYVMQKEILSYLPDVGDIEKTAFPKLAAERKLKAYRHHGFWMTINTVKDLQDVAENIRRIDP
jgi:NDP-sugar pyrophosphorylase family protein